MRSIWKGSISFGLVNIPVRLYTARETKDVRFNSLHRACGTQIRYRKYCPTCDIDVEQEDIIRGYPYEKGYFVTIDDEELEDLPVKTAHQVEIVDFVNLPEIDPIYYQKSYYLEPDSGAEKPYALLRLAMLDTNKVAVAKVAIRHKETLACVRVYGRALVMETMFYPDEIRSTERLAGIDRDADVSERELEMAVKLVDNLSEPFEPEKYRDTYREALIDLIQRKIQGQPQEERAPAPAAGNVIDLMEALEASLQATAQAAASPAKRRHPIKTKKTAASKKKRETGTS